PELLGAGFVFLQRPVLVSLPLRIGNARARNNADRCKRKNGFLESGFHHVTPSAAGWLRALFIWNVSRDEPWSLRNQTGKMLAYLGRVRSAVRARRGERNRIGKKFLLGRSIETNLCSLRCGVGANAHSLPPASCSGQPPMRGLPMWRWLHASR